MKAMVGRFCIACLGRQLYRAGFNPERIVRIKCRVCGQGEEDEPRCKTQSRLTGEPKATERHEAEQGCANPPTGAITANNAVRVK